MTPLITLRPGLTLEAEAAAAWARAEAELGRQIDVNRTIADWDTQMRLYLAYLAYKAGTGPWAPLALHPSKSMHVIGLASDSDDGNNPAVVALLARHGFIRTALDAGEWWHFDYIPSRDQYRGTGFPAGWAARPFEPTKHKEDDTMSIQIQWKKSGLIAQVGPDYFAAMPDMATANIVRNVSSVVDERHVLDDVDAFRVTDSYGIPRDVIKPGSYWSREYANQAAIAALTRSVSTLDTKIAKALEK
ncbi:hypothetical protein [Microbacterium sp. NPDC058389]|uniref:hypothetical protein n=1 Tax=Microbacterium sp. NPDC058389 TaxID=3346475 RepID=UPI003648C255